MAQIFKISENLEYQQTNDHYVMPMVDYNVLLNRSDIGVKFFDMEDLTEENENDMFNERCGFEM